jgi:hypothetical protein
LLTADWRFILDGLKKRRKNILMKKVCMQSPIFARPISILRIVATLVVLEGCVSPASKDEISGVVPAGSPASSTALKVIPVMPVLDPTITATRRGLDLGIDSYNRGDFNGAIRRLASADVARGDLSSRVTALKYSAFSYCVTNRQTLCRQQFGKAFALDPSFDLEPGEKGHPMWGPAFIRAQKMARIIRAK